VKALTVRQPYASRLVHGTKQIENRTRAAYHRGPVLIHASRAIHDWWKLADPEWPLGALIGEAVLTGSHSAHGCERQQCQEQGGMFPGTTDLETGQEIVDGPLHHWVFEQPEFYPEPVPATGMLGFWFLPDSLTDQIIHARRERREGTGR
jgi:hypothetical protein